MTPIHLGAPASAGLQVALLLIVAAALGWLRWGLRAPGPLIAAIALWQLAMAGLAHVGYFARFDQPWRALPTVAASVAMAMWLARRPLAPSIESAQPSNRAVGAWLAAAPPWAWVALQAFRAPLELVLYGLYRQGVIGQRLTFAGSNFDILIGLSALPMAWWMAWSMASRHHVGTATVRTATIRHRGHQAAVIVWNLLGLALLLNIVLLAVLSMPFGFQVFTQEPANRVVAQFPFVWLPTLLVPLALFGHVVSLRRALAARASGADNG
jgi:hypothetical protein